MSLTEWADQLCGALGIEPEFEVDAILDLARDAAHQIDRPAAPLTTFLVGFAAGRNGGTPTSVEDAIDVAVELLSQKE